MKINLFSPWYWWKIVELALNNSHSLPHSNQIFYLLQLFDFKYDFNKAFAEPQSSDKLNELLKECKDNKDMQTQIQIAFAEGYAAKGDNPTSKKALWKKFLKAGLLIATLYILLVVLRVYSVFNGKFYGSIKNILPSNLLMQSPVLKGHHYLVLS